MDKKLTKISTGIIAGMEYQNTQKEKTKPKIVCCTKRCLSWCLFFSYKNEPLFQKNDILKEKRRL